MTMASFKFRLEHLLWILVALIAAALRFGSLGELPLSDQEAVHALAAAESSEYGSPFPVIGDPIVPHSAAYHSLTAMVFNLLGASNAMARAVPALFGVAMVLLPLTALNELGRSRALMLAILLGLSPTLVTISRLAGGSAIGLFGIGALMVSSARASAASDGSNRWLVVGIGSLIVSGVTWVHVLIAIGLSLALSRLWHWLSDRQFSWGIEFNVDWTTLAAIAAFVILLSAGLGLFPSGLIGLSSPISDWLTGWRAGQELNYLPVLTWFISIFIYEPLTLFLGIVGFFMVSRHKDNRPKALIWLTLGSLIYFLVYPGREPSSIAVILLPWLYFASVFLESLLEKLLADSKPAGFYILAGLLVVLSMHLYFFMADLGQGPSFLSRLANALNTSLELEIAVAALQLSWIIIVIFVGVAMVVVVGQGWGWQLALQSSTSVLVILLGIINLSSIWRLNYSDNAASAKELWRSHSSTPIVFLMRETLERMSLAHSGTEHGMPVQAETSLPAAIAWELRDFDLPDSQGALEAEPVPAIIMPLNFEGSTLPADYVGQSLKTHESWSWSGILPPSPLRWWIQRTAPTLPEWWVVLVRQDIVLVGESNELE